jgi:hypothetical protein
MGTNTSAVLFTEVEELFDPSSQNTRAFLLITNIKLAVGGSLDVGVGDASTTHTKLCERCSAPCE